MALIHESGIIRREFRDCECSFCNSKESVFVWWGLGEGHALFACQPCLNHFMHGALIDFLRTIPIESWDTWLKQAQLDAIKARARRTLLTLDQAAKKLGTTYAALYTHIRFRRNTLAQLETVMRKEGKRGRPKMYVYDDQLEAWYHRYCNPRNRVNV